MCVPVRASPRPCRASVLRHAAYKNSFGPATFMPPRGRPTLVVLSLVISSSVASFSSASSCDTAACRSLVLAASFAFSAQLRPPRGVSWPPLESPLATLFIVKFFFSRCPPQSWDTHACSEHARGGHRRGSTRAARPRRRAPARRRDAWRLRAIASAPEYGAGLER